MKRNMYENKCIENSSLFTSLCSVEVQQSGRNGTCFCIFNEILIPFSLRSDGVKEMTECMVKRHLAFRNYDIGPKGVYKIHIVQFKNMLAPFTGTLGSLYHPFHCMRCLAVVYVFMPYGNLDASIPSICENSIFNVYNTQILE